MHESLTKKLNPIRTSQTISVAGNCCLVVAGNCSLVVAGNSSLVVAGNRSLVVAGNRSLVVAGNCSLVVAGNCSLVVVLGRAGSWDHTVDSIVRNSQVWCRLFLQVFNHHY